ncbi:hypothetical protein SRHO_G00207960 [Serrasalmus rhombeus]
MRLFPLPLIPALVTVPTPGQLTQPLRAWEGGHSPGHWLLRDEDKDQGLARGYEEPEGSGMHRCWWSTQWLLLAYKCQCELVERTCGASIHWKGHLFYLRQRNQGILGRAKEERAKRGGFHSYLYKSATRQSPVSAAAPYSCAAPLLQCGLEWVDSPHTAGDRVVVAMLTQDCAGMG